MSAAGWVTTKPRTKQQREKEHFHPLYFHYLYSESINDEGTV